MRYRIWIAAGVLAGVALGAQAYGQKGGTAGAATSTGTNPEAASGVGKYSNYDNMAEHQRGSLYFTGKVKVEDATFPWDPIPVVVTCNGVVRYRTQAARFAPELRLDRFEVRISHAHADTLPGPARSDHGVGDGDGVADGDFTVDHSRSNHACCVGVGIPSGSLPALRLGTM